MFLKKKQQLTIVLIYEKILQETVKNVVHLNLFDCPKITIPKSPKCFWSRSTVYRFMKSIGFDYEEKLPQCEYKLDKEGFLKMCYNHLGWLEYNREEE